MISYPFLPVTTKGAILVPKSTNETMTMRMKYRIDKMINRT